MEIRYSNDSLKFLHKQPKKTVERIRIAVKNLTLNPPIGDIAILKGYTDGRKRLRVGNFRVIYKIAADSTLAEVIEIIFVIDIGNRGDIYKK